VNIDIRIRNGGKEVQVSSNEIAPTITLPEGLFLEAVLVGRASLPRTMILLARERKNPNDLKIFVGTLPSVTEAKVVKTETLRDGGSKKISFEKDCKVFELVLSITEEHQVTSGDKIHSLRRVY
jgi:hypothetical protein